MKRVDFNSLMALIFVGVLAALAYFFQDALKSNLRFILEGGFLEVFLVISVAVVVLSHSLKVNESDENSPLIFKSGFKPLDVFLTVGTYVAITSTACSLLEGAYIQQVFGVEYFTKFGELDINVLIGVSALLMWYVIFHMYKMLKELLFIPEEVSTLSDGASEKSALD